MQLSKQQAQTLYKISVTLGAASNVPIVATFVSWLIPDF